MLARQSLYAIAVPILCAIHGTIQAIAVLVTHIAGLATTTDTTLFLAQKWLAAGLTEKGRQESKPNPRKPCKATEVRVDRM